MLMQTCQVPAYQPETAYQIFMRALFNKDIATGAIDTANNPSYSTSGPKDTLAHRNEAIEQPLQFCYTLDPSSTCTEEQIEAVLNGSATICRYIVKDRNSTLLFPELMGLLDRPGCGSETASSKEMPGQSNATNSSSPPLYTGRALAASRPVSCNRAVLLLGLRLGSVSSSCCLLPPGLLSAILCLCLHLRLCTVCQL